MSQEDLDAQMAELEAELGEVQEEHQHEVPEAPQVDNASDQPPAPAADDQLPTTQPDAPPAAEEPQAPPTAEQPPAVVEPAPAKSQPTEEEAPPAAAPSNVPARKTSFAAPKKAPAASEVAKPATAPKPKVGTFKKVTARPVTAPEEVKDASQADAPASDPPSNDDEASGSKPKPAAPKKIKPVAATLKKGDVKKTTGAGTSAAVPEKVAKKAKNAYMFFLDAKRAEIKEANPDIKLGEVSKKAGEMWRELDAQGKAPYEAQAAADKERYAREVEMYGPPPARKTKAKNTAAEPKEKRPKAKTGCELFIEEKQEEMRESNPNASEPELNKLLRKAWSDLTAPEQAPYNDQAKFLKKEAAAANKTAKNKTPGPSKNKKRNQEDGGSDGEEDDQAVDYDDGDDQVLAEGDEDEELDTGNAASNKRSAPARAASGSRTKRVRPNTAGGASSEGGAEEDEEIEYDEDEEDKDYEEVSWDLHPAKAIIGKNYSNNTYLVARQGLPLHRYGEVSISQANSAKSGQSTLDANGNQCPLSPDLLQEYEDWTKKFNLNVHDSRVVDPKSRKKELNLISLPQGSLLEACKLLGDLRGEGMELEQGRNKNKHLLKDDDFMSVPLLGTCRVVQRLIDVERRAVAAAEAEAAAYKARWLDAEKELQKVGKASAEGISALQAQET